VPDRPLPYGRQSIDESDIAAVAEVLRSDFLTTGPTIARFEEDLAEVVGARHAVAVSSGTAALHTMYFAADIGPGDEIITSPLTFAATANAALYLGATVRFADIDPATGNIDPAAVPALLSARTRAIVAVDFAGHPADYDALQRIGDEHGVQILADAAHALGAAFHGRQVGTLARASALSFHPVKHVTTAEGGAVVTEDPELARRASRFRTHGITKDPADLPPDAGPWYHEQVDLGFNYRLTDLQAALGRSQLRRLPQFLRRRREIAARYLDAFSDVDAIELPGIGPGVEPSWHLFVIRVRDAARRGEVFATLRRRGLGVQVHYIPVYRHPYYRQLGYPAGLCPVAEDFYARAISLPIYPLMEDADVERVVDEVRTAVTAT
jgi:UDP-4-amino-4,6-dideoxy-N-acetyl-beta-L-altrosamine transaminase